MGVSVSGGGAAAKTASFTLGPDVKVLTEDGRPVEPGSDEVGVLALGGRNPLGYYKDEEKSDRTFKEIDGVRYSIPGDFAQVDADGTIHLLGRGSVCINSGGEKIFPEEVEEALKTHDAVRDAVVVGIPHPTYGEQIVAVVEPVDGAPVPERGRADRAREGAPGVATRRPRRVRCVATIGRAPNGKVDYKRHRAESIEELGARSSESAAEPAECGRASGCGPAGPGRACARLAPCSSPRSTPRSARTSGARSSRPIRSGTWSRPGGPDRDVPGRGADAVRARRRHGVAASRAGEPGVRRAGREPAGGAQRGRRLGLHPLVVEGDRRGGPGARDPDDVLRRGAAGRHGDGARRADGAGQRGRHPAAPAGDLPARRRRWPTRPRRTRRSCSGSSGSRSGSSRCRPSSSTAATSTRRTGGRWCERLRRAGRAGRRARPPAHVVRRLES